MNRIIKISFQFPDEIENGAIRLRGNDRISYQAIKIYSIAESHFWSFCRRQWKRSGCHPGSNYRF